MHGACVACIGNLLYVCMSCMSVCMYVCCFCACMHVARTQAASKPVEVTFVSYADEEDSDLALEAIYPW